MTPRPLYDAIEELRSAREDLQRASYQTFDGVFDRYVALLAEDTAIGTRLGAILPPVDFDGFWTAAKQTMGGMVGSGKLAFPVEKKARVAMQLALLRAMAAGEPAVNEVTYIFFHTGNNFNSHRHEMVTQVIEPFHRDVVGLLNPFVQEEKLSERSHTAENANAPVVNRAFIDPARLSRLRELQSQTTFDLRKLIRLCEELNLAYGNRAWFSLAFLTRTVLNHVAPVFGQKTFAQVASQATPKHFKLAAEALDVFARKVSDFHLHEPIAKHLTLPTETQVSMQVQMDIVLSEVERELSKLS